MRGSPNGKNGRISEWAFIRDVLRDVAIIGLGTFMLIHETLDMTPNIGIIGAALALLGIPAALRLDAWVRRNGGG